MTDGATRAVFSQSKLSHIFKRLLAVEESAANGCQLLSNFSHGPSLFLCVPRFHLFINLSKPPSFFGQVFVHTDW